MSAVVQVVPFMFHTNKFTKIQDIKYFILSFHVYNYTHLGLFTHTLKIIHTHETKRYTKM